MNPFKKVWVFLDGKKVNIGATMLVSAAIISGAAPFIPAIPLLAAAVPVLTTVGTSLGGVGLAHKVLKWFGVVSPSGEE